MYYSIGLEQFKGDIENNSEYIDVTVDKRESLRVFLSKQRTGYGYKNFMICPFCGTRHIRLYLCNQKLMCRKCFPENVYSGIQHHNKGGNKDIAYRIYRYAAAHGVTIKRFPFNYWEYDKPKNRKEASWVNILTVLQALEDMRYQTIAYHKIWNSKTIKSILTWTNTLMYLFDLSEIQDRQKLICWDNGVNMNFLDSK